MKKRYKALLAALLTGATCGRLSCRMWENGWYCRRKNEKSDP